MRSLSLWSVLVVGHNKNWYFSSRINPYCIKKCPHLNKILTFKACLLLLGKPSSGKRKTLLYYSFVDSFSTLGSSAEKKLDIGKKILHCTMRKKGWQVRNLRHTVVLICYPRKLCIRIRKLNKGPQLFLCFCHYHFTTMYFHAYCHNLYIYYY